MFKCAECKNESIVKNEHMKSDGRIRQMYQIVYQVIK